MSGYNRKAHRVKQIFAKCFLILILLWVPVAIHLELASRKPNLFLYSLLIIFDFLVITAILHILRLLPIKESLFGFINKAGNLVIDYKYSMAKPFSEGLSSVTIAFEGRCYINKEGTIEFWHPYQVAHSFQEGLALVRKGSKYGFINKEGSIQIKLQYNNASSFSEGLAAVREYKKWGYIDKTGEIIIEPKYDYGGEFHNNLALIQIGKFYG